MNWRKWIYLLIAGVLLAGCGPVGVGVLSPNSEMAAREANLFWLSIYLGAGVFALVLVLWITALVRGARRAKQAGEPKQVQGNTKIEIIWTAIPILLVLFIFFMTLRTMQAVAAPPPAAGDINVKVIGHRWWWEFDYPDLGIKTANQLVIPVGANVHLEMTSADVIHSFWVPQLNGKLDVVPGQINKTWIKADKEGVFEGHCTEYCGLQHANMAFQVVAKSQADYETWVKGQQAPPPAQVTSDAAAQGGKIVTAGICSTCHTVNGTNAKGVIGPNLTHLYSRTIIAGGVLPLTDDNLRLWLQNPGNVKPGNLMSSVKLTDQQIEEVIAYLKTLK